MVCGIEGATSCWKVNTVIIHIVCRETGLRQGQTTEFEENLHLIDEGRADDGSGFFHAQGGAP